MIVCPYCQAQNADTAAYCTRCGQVIGRAAPPAAGGGMAEGERKGLALTSLILGILSIPTGGCLFVGAVAAIVCGFIALGKVKNEPGVYGGRGMAIGGIATAGASLLLVIPIGIISAIAIPSLLRARLSSNESMAIGDTRTVISAEAAYQSANNGSYDSLSCLGTPSSCIPNYTGQWFLDHELASGAPKGGYKRTLHLGPAPDEVTDQMSPSSVAAYAYVALPITPGKTGVRGICGDSRGIICVTAAGTEPEVVNGECQVGPRCEALR